MMEVHSLLFLFLSPDKPRAANTVCTADLKKVLRDILDSSNHPLLIHCNKGKHRTGSVVGCLRKIRDWSLSSIVSKSCSRSHNDIEG